VLGLGACPLLAATFNHLKRFLTRAAASRGHRLPGSNVGQPLAVGVCCQGRGERLGEEEHHWKGHHASAAGALHSDSPVSVNSY
jgi:hypothetical protein